MSTIDDITREQMPANIVRLKVEGARNTVNTLSDQQTPRGVSLICPFPALEVNLPASFGSTLDGEMRSGTIHRIGVEDDPETGLPRLRLSIRSSDTRSTVIEQPSITLIDESCRRSEPEELPLPQKVEVEEGLGAHSFEISCDDEDPEWVNCDEIPLPEEFLARSKTRRRYKMVRKAVYLALILVIAAGGFVLERSGTISLDDVRSYVAGLSINTKGPKKAAPEDKFEAYSSPAEVVPEMIEEEAPVEEQLTTETEYDSPTLDEAVDESKEAEPLPDETEAASAVKLASAQVADSDETVPGADGQAAGMDEDPADSEVLENEITVMLPTRWPVEYASGYRIRDPNGVVIDVPGGLVKKEGFLEAASEHPMIRSIKSIQRETGARFIVYVQGELPRFMTSPKGNGVALRLYDLAGDDLSSQEVALAP